MDASLFNLINPVKDFLIFSVNFFDNFIFNGVNQFALTWFWLDVLAIFLAEYLGYILLFSLLLFLAVGFRKYFNPVKFAPQLFNGVKMIVEAIISAILARFVIVELIRWIWQRPRPFVENNVNLLLTHNASAFPSGHAAFFFAVSTIVYFYNKKAGVFFFISSFLICLARVFTGIHWPADILAGIAVGILSAWLVHKTIKKCLK